MPLSQPPRYVEPQISFGRNLNTGEEVSFDRSFFNDIHAHIRGSTGSGKTSRAILPLVLQLMALPTPPEQEHPEPIFILDLGGEPANFHIIRERARQMGRKFRFLSLDNAHDSDYFNPFQALDPSNQHILELVTMLIRAFNLDYGLFYGGDYFTSQNTKALLKVAQRLKTMPHDLAISVDELADELDRQKTRDADQVRTTFMFLREYQQLKTELAPPDRLIDIGRAIEDGEVVYFFFPAITQSISIRPVAGVALYTIERLADRRIRTGQSFKKSWVFVDEFHEIAGVSFQKFLIQCRHSGLSLFLANQHNSQLRNRDVDLEPLVASNTQLKLYFSVQGEQEIREIQSMSKTTRIQLKSTTRGSSQGTSRGTSKGHTVAESYGGQVPRTSESEMSGHHSGQFNSTSESETFSEQIAPELEFNDILDVDAKAGCFFLLARVGDQHRQPLPVQGHHVVSREVYEQVRIQPLPPRPISDAPTVTPPPKPTTPAVSRPRNPERQTAMEEIWSTIEDRFRFEEESP